MLYRLIWSARGVRCRWEPRTCKSLIDSGRQSGTSMGQSRPISFCPRPRITCYPRTLTSQHVHVNAGRTHAERHRCVIKSDDGTSQSSDTLVSLLSLLSQPLGALPHGVSIYHCSALPAQAHYLLRQYGLPPSAGDREHRVWLKPPCLRVAPDTPGYPDPMFVSLRLMGMRFSAPFEKNSTT
jgi:hypothetical protein